MIFDLYPIPRLLRCEFQVLCYEGDGREGAGVGDAFWKCQCLGQNEVSFKTAKIRGVKPVFNEKLHDFKIIFPTRMQPPANEDLTPSLYEACFCSDFR